MRLSRRRAALLLHSRCTALRCAALRCAALRWAVPTHQKPGKLVSSEPVGKLTARCGINGGKGCGNSRRKYYAYLSLRAKARLAAVSRNCLINSNDFNAKFHAFTVKVLIEVAGRKSDYTPYTRYDGKIGRARARA